MTFDRYIPLMQRTFALRAFNAHETEINRHYWSFKVISDYSAFRAREAKKANKARENEAKDDGTGGQRQTPEETLTATIFHALGDDAVRIPKTVSDWLEANAEFENWLRLSVLTSASSYLETYLRQVARSALMSDPLCRLGLFREIDGTTLLKQRKEIGCEKELEALTKGSWSQRRSGFSAIFGDHPSILDSSERELERIRAIRNSYAHGFGRDLKEIPSPLNKSPGSSERISQKRLMQSIATISKVAAGVDSFLLKRFIGNFELLLFFMNLGTNPLKVGKQPEFSSDGSSEACSVMRESTSI